MSEILPFALVMALLLVGVVLAGRHQMRSYKAYLDEHTAETARQTANQRQMTEMQVAAMDRQTEVLVRIAESLDRRG